MTRHSLRPMDRRWGIALGLGLFALGCAGRERSARPVSIENPREGWMTIAVVPALNQSGSTDFDPARFGDLMALELAAARSIRVVPVSRVLAALNSQGADRVLSPAHALEVARLTGADAILVFSVTRYDPYDPPSIGITAQLYGAWPGQSQRSLDPVALSRQAGAEAPVAEAPRTGLLAETGRVFDASHQSTARDVEEYATRRGAENSPYGWRKHVVSQQLFIQFCCHETIRALLSAEGTTSRTVSSR